MSKTHSHNPEIADFMKEVEAKFFAKGKTLQVTRYEVIVTFKGDVMLGTITTSLSLDAYLREHDMILHSCVSKGPAMPNAVVGHDLV
jgi:hypothetical protein